MVRTPGDLLDLLVVCNLSHDRKHLTSEHHADTRGEDPLHSLSIVIIVAVKPALFSMIDPFLPAQMLRQPICTLLQIFRQIG